MNYTNKSPFSHIVVIGTSAGGVEALSELVSALPADFPAPIFVTHHQAPQGPSMMPAILSRSGAIPARTALDNQPIEPNNIYVAPPDKHLIIKPGFMILGQGPRENSTRPAIDPLFRTAAHAYGSRVIAIVLTGNLDDGTAGLAVVKQHGGVAIVQDPTEASYPGMPESAIENVRVDYVLPVKKIAAMVATLIKKSGDTPNRNSQGPEEGSDRNIYNDPAEGIEANMSSREDWGTPSVYVCPDCHGTLWETDQPGAVLRFRCRVGHAFSATSLAAQQSERIEEALWTALRALEERASLAHKMAERAARQSQLHSQTRFEQQKRELEERAEILRELLRRGQQEAQPDKAG
jgi:two-component system chemotaxis response regulator CheB